MKIKDVHKLYTVKPEEPNDPDGIRQYFQRIIENLPNNVYWLNRQCITMGCNRNTLKLIGLNYLEEFVGITYEEMGRLAGWTEDQAQSFKKDDLEVMETGQPKLNVEEPPLYDAEGNPIYYLSSRVPLFDENQQVIGVIGISVDITQRKILERELIESRKREECFKAMSALGGMIAHELRTPLAGIKLAIENWQDYFPQLLKGYSIYAKEHQDNTLRPTTLKAMALSLESTKRAVYRVDNTIHTILMGFHEASSTHHNTLQTFDLNETLYTAIREYPLDPEQKSLISIHSHYPCQVFGDPHIMIHVIQNLLKNALYAIKEMQKGKINLWLEKKNQCTYFYFEDTAKGISKEHLQHIFQPFWSTKQDTAASIGLGLYFCKLALSKMKASIDCESIEKEYTRFIITLSSPEKDI